MARKWAVEFQNLREVKARFQGIAKAISAEKAGTLQSVSEIIRLAYWEAAWTVRSVALDNARSGGVARRLYGGSKPAIFAVPLAKDTQSSVRARKRSSMVGVRTGARPRHDPTLFREWGFGSGKRGMSLGRMFETGTRKIKPRHYFRRAVWGTRGKVISILTKAYNYAIGRLNRIP
jgi:hypothetical protein